MPTLRSNPEKLTGPQRDELREIALNSFHFFCTMVLGYDRFSPPDGLHGRLCQRLATYTGPQLNMVYRGAFKTTTMISWAVWMALRDPVNFEMLVVGPDREMGLAWLGQIGRHVETCVQLHTLFPDIKPDVGQWTKDSRRLSERSDKREGSTWTLRTFEQSWTGRHVSAILIDDPVTEKNYRSRTIQQKLMDKIETVWPVLETDRIIFNGTPYPGYDFWRYLIEHYYPRDLTIFLQPVRGHATITPSGQIAVSDTGVYAHPEEWDDERFEQTKRRMGRNPALFQSQYMLDTSIPESLAFDRSWFSYITPFELKNIPLTTYMATDGASGEGTSRPALVVMGIASDETIYLLYANSDYSTQGQLLNDVFTQIAEYNPVLVGVERFGHGGRTYYQQLQSEAVRRGVLTNFVPLTGRVAKDQRIVDTLWPEYEQRRIVHLTTYTGSELERELIDMPNPAFKDEIDAAAYCVSLCRMHGFQGDRTRTVSALQSSARLPSSWNSTTLTSDQASDAGLAMKILGIA